MPRSLNILIVLFLFGMTAFVQNVSAQSLDTLNNKVGNKVDTLNNKVDSVSHKISNKIDSIKQRINNINIPTIRQPNLSMPDSIKALHTLDSLKGRVNHKVDSIESKINKVGDKVNELQQKANDIPGLDLKTKVNVPNVDLNPDIKIPDLNTPNLNAPNLNTPNITTPNLNTPNLNLNSPNLEVPDLKSLDPKNIDTKIENKVMELDEVKDLQKQSGEMGKAQELINANNPDALKEQAQQQIQQQAVDHFKGKEEALKGAMDKLSKLKQKYSEVSSLKDLPKRPPNPMKGKPLIERIVPGVTLQINNTSRAFMIDLNPVVSYRFSGRINGGLGWNERIAFTKWNKISSHDRIYGPRVFGSFGFKKGISAKAEIEKMNTIVPVSPHSQDGSRVWVWSAFVGLKKDYKFMGKVKGNVQMLYNLWDDHDNSPYFDRFNVRMGFEFPMKKPKKPAEKAGK